MIVTADQGTSSFAFPFDVMAIIILHLDRFGLNAFSLTNHEYNEEVNKQLWYSVTLRFESPNIIQHCDAILHHPSRVRSIRELYIGIHHARLSGTASVDERVQRVCNVLQALPALLSLRILALKEVNPDIVDALIEKPIPARLRLFSWCSWNPPHNQAAFLNFLHTQPHLRALQNEGDGLDEVHIPSSLVPSLEYVSSENLEDARRLVLGRPVHTLDLSARVDYWDASDIGSIASSSTTPILTIRLMTSSDVGQIIQKMTPYLPHLKSFGIHVLRPAATYSGVIAAQRLAAYTDLEEFQWWDANKRMAGDASWRENFTRAAFANCAKLERIVFASEAMHDYYTETFERSDHLGNDDENREGWVVLRGHRKWRDITSAGHYPLKSTWGILAEEF